jgi:hypothetical protein
MARDKRKIMQGDERKMAIASYGLKMRQLPKPEYRLCKALQATYGITDISDLFAIALRLMDEVQRFQGVSGENRGEQWIRNVINSYHSLSEAQRS